ncbi:hypothetical protein GCM10010216_24240 [Streptomyces flaveolus]|nr:hypothetical protein GCM10010216_24240 [Streptomyces flaveolus]
MNTCPSAQRRTVRSIKSFKSLPQEPRLANYPDDESHITGSKERPSRRHSALPDTLGNAPTVRPNSGPPQPLPPPETPSGPTAETPGADDEVW